MVSYDYRSIGQNPLADRASCGLARSVDPLPCTVTVIATDVGDAVSAAGGWMTDRVRAGWRVRAVVPRGSDAQPFQILGVKTMYVDGSVHSSLMRDIPATVALGAATFDSTLRLLIEKLQRERAIEVAIWGDGDLPSSLSFDHVCHQLSAAATTFKARAMAAAAQPPTTASCEFFRSSAQWYSLDSGADLQRIGTRSVDYYTDLSNAQ